MSEAMRLPLTQHVCQRMHALWISQTRCVAEELLDDFSPVFHSSPRDIISQFVLPIGTRRRALATVQQNFMFLVSNKSHLMIILI